jgi:hypothetical protein
LAILNIERIQVDELLPDTVGLTGGILEGSIKQVDNLWGVVYNRSNRRLGGQTAVMILSIWLKRTNARISLLRKWDPKNSNREWSL